MMMLQGFTASDILSLGPRLVGLTFIWAGVIKALEPHIFSRHVAALGWIPGNLLSKAVSAAAALETGLGLALLLGTAPQLVLPLALMVLVGLSAVSWWGVRSGRTNDCGCYGGYIQPSIGQSMMLNGLYALLIAGGWWAAGSSVQSSSWQLVLPVTVVLAVAVYTEIAQLHASRTGQPLIDLNPLKAGRKWKHSWAGGITSGIDGEILVAFLGPDCPYCGQFVKIGNAMVQSPKLPRVVGVVGTSKDRLQSFIDEKGIRFPMANVAQSVTARLVSAVPTAVLIEAGEIKRIWIGNMPPDFVDRFKNAFFPAAASEALT
jgi:uncharacterized membrane protein YphA (DoxX/SURF4 family)